MTQLLFLGSGSAFTVGGDNYQSNIMIIDEQQNKLLIDAGSDIRFSLNRVGLSAENITDIYISHTHSDHIGGLEYIAFNTRFNPRCAKPKLYTHQDIANDLWENNLSGGLRSVQGHLSSLADYFNLHPIKQTDNFFNWQNIRFELVQVIHIDNGQYLMPCYALFFELHGTKIFFTADTQLFLEQLQPFYEKADIIFQDCELSSYPSSVHAHFNELKNLPSSIKNKMWLYGYQPVTLPNPNKYGFLGFVKPRQLFEYS